MCMVFLVDKSGSVVVPFLTDLVLLNIYVASCIYVAMPRDL